VNFATTSLVIAILAVMLAATILQWSAATTGRTRLARALQVLALLAAAYSIVAGVTLLSSWSDPLAGADTADIAGATSRSRRGGVVVLAIRVWPFVVMTLGALSGFTAVLALMTPVVGARRPM
jgi:hypothetical protein